MPIRVALDHPRRHTGRRLRQRARSLAGALLVVVGLAASIVAVPSSAAVAGLAAAWLSNEEIDLEVPAGQRPTVGDILVVWGVSTSLAIFGFRHGRRLVRGERRLVLFLRRFGYDDATSAVTFAVMSTIGRSWRLVTLDDAEISPLGVTTATRRLFRAGGLTSSAVLGLGRLGLRVFPAAVLGLWLVAGIALAEARIWEDARNVNAWITVANPYLEILFATLDGRLPFDKVRFDLPGVFAALSIVAASTFVLMIASGVLVVLAFPLSPVLFFFSSAADAVREAERSKSEEIRTAGEIDAAKHGFVARSRRVLGPRLVVLRVASDIWQRAVRQFASICSVSLIDVSEPTENLAWEIEELTTRSRTTCVFIGQYDRAVRLADARSAGSDAGPFDLRVSSMLEGEEVLAYTADRKGMKRFSRALRARLLTAADESAGQRPGAAESGMS